MKTVTLDIPDTLINAVNEIGDQHSLLKQLHWLNLTRLKQIGNLAIWQLGHSQEIITRFQVEGGEW